jgi:Ca2+-dependent lipid-binding protein
MEARLNIIGARGLPKMDSVGKTDPYVKAQIIGDSKVQKTATINNTDFPVWNAQFIFPVVSYGTQILDLNVFDEDVAKDDEIGGLKLQLYELPPGRVIDHWYRLTPAKGIADAGELHIRIQVALTGAPLFVDAPFQPLNLKVGIIEAKDLPNLDSIGKTDPYAELNLINSPQKYRTKVIKESLAPRWAETAEFIVTNPAVDIIRVVLRDEDVAADDEIGGIDIALAKVTTSGVSDGWYPLTMKKKGGRGSVHLTLQFIPAPPQPYSDEAPGAIGKFKKA